MLTHENILANCQAGLSAVAVDSTDTFLSFLPLSHMFERTVGYYIPVMAGACVAYARSIKQLGKDMEVRQPTVLVAVPRIFERVHARLQASLQEKGTVSRWLFNLTVYVGWQRFERGQNRRKHVWLNWLWPILDKMVASKVRSRLGGKVRIAVSGGAPLSFEVARLVIGMGVTLLQGYGLTETSPVLSVNRPEENVPRSVGRALPDVEIRLSDDNEVLARGVNIMAGYWQNPKATAAVLDQDGWLHTGDKGYFDENRRLYISGRIKDILVLSNGEKVPPEDLELAIALDPLFDLALVAGEQRPFLTAIVVLNPAVWEDLAAQLNLDSKDKHSLNSEILNDVLLQRIGGLLAAFPGYEQIRQVIPTLTPWGIDDGLITPPMKVRRKKVLERFHEQLEHVYQYKGRRSSL